MSECSAEKPRNTDDMTKLPRPGNQDEQLQQLMAEFYQRRRNGEAVTPDAWAASHPEFRGALLKLFEQAGQSLGDSATGQADGTVIVPGGAGAGDSETMIEDSQLSGREARLSRDAPPTRFGRYRIIRELGRGAMGAVYLAQDEQLHRQVALKIPQFGADMNRGLLERFYREARAAAALRHPGICPVYDVGEIDGQHYITMAYIEGRPLRDFTKSSKRQAGRQVARVIRKLALALEVAHQNNVIHRDLKPANVMIDNSNEPVVMDFGLARLSVEGEERLTHTGTVIGTPAYMSPEQVDGDNNRVSPRSDIYSLGVIFYELLTGQLPFQGNLMSILRKIATEEPRPPVELHSDIDPALQAICLKMMAKQPEQRYGSMSEVAQELAAWMQGRSSGVEESGALETSRAPGSRRPPRREELTEAASTDEPPVAEIADDVPEWSESPGRPRRRRTKKSTARKRAGIPKWAMGAGGAVALLVVIVFLLTRSGPTDHSAAPVASNTAVAGGSSSTPQVRNTGPKSSLVTTSPDQRGAAFAPDSSEWQSLFDGRSLAGWRGVDGGPPPADWKINSDAIVAPGSKSWIVSENEYRDFELELEWKVDAGANGGVVYGWAGATVPSSDGVRLPAPEYQIVDNSRHPNGKQPITAAASVFAMYEPSEDASKPAGQWNQARIVVRGASAEHWLNGKRVVSYVRGSDDWKQRAARNQALGSQPGFSQAGPGRIALQSYSGQIDYRNIRIRQLNASLSARRLDVLSMINVTRDGVGRSWSMANGVLKTIAGPSENDRRLYLPIENPRDEYDLRLKVQRATARDNALVLGLISSGHRFSVVMDGFKSSSGGLWGLEQIDGKVPRDNGTAVRNEPLKVDVPAEVLVQVRKNGIRVERDGRPLIDWTGSADRLSLHAKWNDQGPPRFFLGAQGDFIIQELSLEPVSADESGWIELSNGRDLSGWKPVGHHGWTVENEVLRGVTTTQKGPGWLMSEREFQDFELDMEYRLSPGSNSGVFLRAGPEGNVGGGQFREIQLLDDGDPSFAAVAPVQRTGAVFGQVAPSPLLRLPASTWHHLRIRLQGQQVQVAINGTRLLDHAVTSLPPKGRIGLQLYPSQVEFRRIRVRPLTQAVGGTAP